MSIVEIPEPCPENWEGMKPSAAGRFCDRCCKVVVDFTTKTAEEIRDYFLAKKEERVCGRFKLSQIRVPAASQKRAWLARFALALYFVFGGMLFTSCDPFVMGARIPDSTRHTDSMDLVRQKEKHDSIAKADSLKKTSGNTTGH